MYIAFVVGLFLLATVFASAAAFFRLWPSFGGALRSIAIALLIISVRFYFLLLSRLAPVMERWLGIRVLDGLPRIAATTLLSLAIGCLVLVLAGWGPNRWTVLLLAGHGLLTGLVWEEVLDDDGLQLGVRQ